jgi:radical SAM superfamily enzyme YgiQ (UPF0313 family)
MTMAAALRPEFESTLIDGNLDSDAVRSACEAVRVGSFAAVGITVMGGPQVATAIEMSRALRAAQPALPIIWGGYFPTLYPEVTLNNDYVDYAIRGQGEDAMRELLGALAAMAACRQSPVSRGARMTGWCTTPHAHSLRVALRHRSTTGCCPIPGRISSRLSSANVRLHTRPRSAAGSAAPSAGWPRCFAAVPRCRPRIDSILISAFLKHRMGADSIQFYDHNFFDREVEMVPVLEVLARHALPWWCYARADALVNLSADSWKLVRKSRLRMAYIGAETPMTNYSNRSARARAPTRHSRSPSCAGAMG